MSVQYNQNRGLTTAQWQAKNPILLANEVGLEIDSNRIKIGNGIDRWIDIPYYIFKEVVGTMPDTSFNLSQEHGTLVFRNISSNTVFTDELNHGESITLHLTNAYDYTVTFPSCNWITIFGNIPPNLTDRDVIIFWKVDQDLFGSYIGSYDHAVV